MAEFKVRVSDVLVGRDTVRTWVYIAPNPNQTFQNCGELVLTREEGFELKQKLES